MTRAAVIGAGPAGLMAAEVMAKAGLSVTVYEAKPSPARKFLMAGKSGLNLTLEGDFDRLLSGYGNAAEALRPALEAFDNTALRHWAEGLGIEVFSGSTGRVFPKAMKASPLLRAWLGRLDALGVSLERRAQCSGLFGTNPIINDVARDSDVTVLACGGASWARLGSDGRWAEWLQAKTVPFEAANAGVRVAWTPSMQRFWGQAVKNVRWHAGDVVSQGEGVVTADGLEGGGLYSLTPAVRRGAQVTIDLLPERDIPYVVDKLEERPKKVTLSRWLNKSLKLPAVKVGLVFEATGGVPDMTMHDLAHLIKAVPVATSGVMSIDKAISTAGGVSFSELDPDLMLRDQRGVFCCGEMLDWEAPTGGWLLTGCFATGAWAGAAAARYVS